MSARDCKHGSLARSCEVCSLEDQLATLRSEVAYVRRHLEGYASSIIVLKDGDGRASLNVDDFVLALREDSDRLGKLGGGAS